MCTTLFKAGCNHFPVLFGKAIGLKKHEIILPNLVNLRNISVRDFFHEVAIIVEEYCEP